MSFLYKNNHKENLNKFCPKITEKRVIFAPYYFHPITIVKSYSL